MHCTKEDASSLALIHPGLDTMGAKRQPPKPLPVTPICTRTCRTSAPGTPSVMICTRLPHGRCIICARLHMAAASAQQRSLAPRAMCTGVCRPPAPQAVHLSSPQRDCHCRAVCVSGLPCRFKCRVPATGNILKAARPSLKSARRLSAPQLQNLLLGELPRARTAMVPVTSARVGVVPPLGELLQAAGCILVNRKRLLHCNIPWYRC